MYNLLFLVLVLVCPFVRPRECNYVDQCHCTFDDGSGTIDLTGIGKQDGTALAQDQFAADNYAYSYNPCYPFTEGTCVNAAACQFDSANVIYYNIGDSAQVTFHYDGLNVQATYIADDQARSSVVTLVCDPTATSASVEVKGESSTAGVYVWDKYLISTVENTLKRVYSKTVITIANNLKPDQKPGYPVSDQDIIEFTVTTKEACVAGSSIVVTTSVTISVGSVLLIVFFSIIIVYFVAGAVFMKFGRHRTGKEVIPGVTLWTALPGLVKDGFGFVVGKTCRRRSGYSGV